MATLRGSMHFQPGLRHPKVEAQSLPRGTGLSSSCSDSAGGGVSLGPDLLMGTPKNPGWGIGGRNCDKCPLPFKPPHQSWPRAHGLSRVGALWGF